MPAITQDELLSEGVNIRSERWLDVNSQYGLNNKPVLLPGVAAINNSLRNLFGCPIGHRGRIFQPTYGTLFYPLLQEPMDAITANKIRASTIQSIERWEPRIRLDYRNTAVIPDTANARYVVRIVYFYLNMVHTTLLAVS